MIRLAGRAAAYMERFFIATENLGFTNAVKLFSLASLGVHSDDVALPVSLLKRDIHFRGVDDKGVMSHFFTPGYRIVDTPDQRVRVIVDAGANIGDETIRFRYFHPDATIVALEPQPGNYRLLTKNVEGDPNTIIMPKGLWSHECDLNIVASDSNEGFSVCEVPIGTGEVQAVSIDSILAMLSSRSDCNGIDILKLDIEGAEYEVFSKNYEAWIPRVKVIIVECPDQDRPGTAMTIFRALSGLDFNMSICGENLVMIRNDVPWKVQISQYLN
jgi:FkbM family methyltransferase